jgi:hypothetical protein
MDIPVAEDVVYLIARLSEGNPFYISYLFQSSYSDKDFTTREGVLKTLEFETLHAKGEIRGVWAEYIAKIFVNVNERHAKNIILYLCKNRDRQVGRKELLETLKLDMSDLELEQKMQALVKSDVISQGDSLFFYRGVRDNIFDKVFRGMYGDDIAAFTPKTIPSEYQALYERVQKEYQALLGKYNQTKGLFAEFAIINQLRLYAYRNQELFRSITHNLPADFQFGEYAHVWSYKTARPDKRDIQLDIFACTGPDAYSIIGEVKNRATKPFSADEAARFVQKTKELQELEQVEKAVLFIFSRKGFTVDALAYFQEHDIAWSDDERWLGE